MKRLALGEQDVVVHVLFAEIIKVLLTFIPSLFLICCFICRNKRKSYYLIFLCLQKSKLFHSWFHSLANQTITRVDSIKVCQLINKISIPLPPISGVVAAQVLLLLPPGQSIFTTDHLIMKKKVLGKLQSQPINF